MIVHNDEEPIIIYGRVDWLDSKNLRPFLHVCLFFNSCLY